MFSRQVSKIHTILARALPSTETIKLNQGSIYQAVSRAMSTGEFGSGAGKGGGSGGSVRDAGGSLGKKGAAQEEMYFSKQNKAMKDKLKEHLEDEVKKHEEAIKASKELIKEIETEK